MKWLLVLACACSSNHGTPTTNGSGATPPTGCDAAKAKVEQLYRAEAKGEKPERQTEAVADNTTMVMNECVKSPDKVIACINRVSTSAELEKQCLAPLDDEGTEGEALRK
jgi:hypothetical protein